MKHFHSAAYSSKNSKSINEQNDVFSPIIEAFMLMDRWEIEKFIFTFIDHLDVMDGDPDLEQDNIDEPNGDEGDYSYPEWRAAG